MNLCHIIAGDQRDCWGQELNPNESKHTPCLLVRCLWPHTDSHRNTHCRTPLLSKAEQFVFFLIIVCLNSWIKDTFHGSCIWLCIPLPLDSFQVFDFIVLMCPTWLGPSCELVSEEKPLKTSLTDKCVSCHPWVLHCCWPDVNKPWVSVCRRTN